MLRPRPAPALPRIAISPRLIKQAGVVAGRSFDQDHTLAHPQPASRIRRAQERARVTLDRDSPPPHLRTRPVAHGTGHLDRSSGHLRAQLGTNVSTNDQLARRHPPRQPVDMAQIYPR